MSTVSIVIPCTSKKMGLTEALKSIESQEGKLSISIILVENNSDCRESIKRIINQFPSLNIKHRYLENCPNANVARNVGVLESESKYIAYLDSDDEWKRDHLINSLSCLEESGRQAIFSATYINRGKIVQLFEAKDVNDYTDSLDFLFGKDPGFAQTSSYILHKDVFTKVKWDESLKRNQDYDFFIKVYNEFGWAFSKKPTVIVNWPIGERHWHDFESYKKFFSRYSPLMNAYQARSYLFARLIDYAFESQVEYNWFREQLKGNSSKLCLSKEVALKSRVTLKLAWYFWYFRECLLLSRIFRGSQEKQKEG